MSTRETADVVIVGTGAGGATLGGELAEAGAKVLFLEAGQDLDITYGSPKHFAANQTMNDFIEQGLLWHEEYEGTNWRTDMGECVGGGTTAYGGVLEESVPDDFAKWPFSYQEFLPYIELTKKRYHVHRWSIEELSPSARYLHEISGGELEPIQSGYIHEPFEEYGVYHDKCRLCRYCLLGCKFNAKANALTIALPKARYFGARVESMSLATQLVTNAAGTRITSIKYLKRTKTGINQETVEEREVFADKFVLAAGSMMTPMLLHWSGRRGRALANSSGQVGKNLRAHFVRHVMAVLGRDDLYTYQGQVVELGDKFRNYHKGFLTEINMVAPSAMMAMVYEIMHNEVAADFVGVNFKRLLRSYGRLINATPMAKSEDDGFTDNSIMPHRWRRNKYKLPLPVVKLEPNAIERERVRAGHEHAEALFRKAGADPKNIWVGRLDNVHKKGSCRMGKDPSDSVVDLNGKSWDIDNLWLADASIFPAPLMANCAFIIYALAYKIADGMLGRTSRVE